MKLLTLILVSFTVRISQLNVTSQSQSDKIIGIYYTPKKDGKVQIYKENGKYYGKTIEADNPRKDIKNPNPNLRDSPIIGLIFLRDFVFKEGEYIDGSIYDPDNGKTYDCKMWLEGENLKARGYIGINLLGRTEEFKKVK